MEGVQPATLTQGVFAKAMCDGKAQSRPVRITLRPDRDGQEGALLLIQMQISKLVDTGAWFTHLWTVKVRKRIIEDERTGTVVLTDDRLTPELFAEAMLPYVQEVHPA